MQPQPTKQTSDPLWHDRDKGRKTVRAKLVHIVTLTLMTPNTSRCDCTDLV